LGDCLAGVVVSIDKYLDSDSLCCDFLQTVRGEDEKDREKEKEKEEEGKSTGKGVGGMLLRVTSLLGGNVVRRFTANQAWRIGNMVSENVGKRPLTLSVRLVHAKANLVAWYVLHAPHSLESPPTCSSSSQHQR
jgi:hypothetical protein